MSRNVDVKEFAILSRRRLENNPLDLSGANVDGKVTVVGAQVCLEPLDESLLLVIGLNEFRGIILTPGDIKRHVKPSSARSRENCLLSM